jgi:hypothetical protein
MASSNLWGELAATYLRTRSADQDHEIAKAELKKFIPKEANGHGIRAERSKSGAIASIPFRRRTPMHQSSGTHWLDRDAKAPAELTNPEKTWLL